MSYEIVRNISIKDNKVHICCAPNNVRPRYYEKQEWKWMTDLLVKEGREAVDIAILSDYEAGNLQRGTNKYTRALSILRRMPEYRAFNWRLSGMEYEQVCNNREDKTAFNILLQRALNTPQPKDVFVISQSSYSGQKYYLSKVTSCTALFNAIGVDKAKVFRWLDEAEGLKSAFTNGDKWVIEKIN